MNTLNLQFLDLRKNRIDINKGISDINKGIVYLHRFKNLQALILENINLHQVDEDRFAKMFGLFTHLRTLSLSSSILEFVSPAAFSNFTNITTLLLRDNSITWIPEGCFDALQYLERLDLAGNTIAVLSQRTFSDQLRGRFTSLDLSENPLVCDCDLLWLRDWFFLERSLFASDISE
jgi:Leucine-rich repeat (LRR) protein